MDSPVESFKSHGFDIDIHYDTVPIDPRKDCDNLSTMVCFNSHHNLGDEQPKTDPETFLSELALECDRSFEDIEYHWTDGPGWANLVNKANTADQYCTEATKVSDALIEKARDKILGHNLIMLPLYLYDHSGITMSTGPFSCPWDSGQVGFIYITREQILKEYGWKVITTKRREQIVKYLIADVEIYDQYLTGDVYGYMVEDNDGEDIDSCWGFYGIEVCKQEAINAAKYARSHITETIGKQTELQLV